VATALFSRQRVLKGLVAALAFAAVAWCVDLRLVARAISAVSAGDILILAALSFALIGVSVWKWGCFLSRLGIRVGFWRLFRLYLIGYFINILAPSFVGGDVVRSLYLGSAVDKTRAVSATFLERYTGVVAMLVLALCAVSVSTAATTQIRLLVLALAAGCGVATWLLFSGVLAKVVRRLGVGEKVTHFVGRVQEGLEWGMRDAPLVIKTLGISLLFHLLTIVNTAAVGAAIGWSGVPWADLLVVVPLILIVGAVPISPQGLGIQEGAFVYFLSSVGVSSDHALAIALVLRAKSYLLAILGGVLWYGVRAPLKDSANEPVNP